MSSPSTRASEISFSRVFSMSKRAEGSVDVEGNEPCCTRFLQVAPRPDVKPAVERERDEARASRTCGGPRNRSNSRAVARVGRRLKLNVASAAPGDEDGTAKAAAQTLSDTANCDEHAAIAAVHRVTAAQLDFVRKPGERHVRHIIRVQRRHRRDAQQPKGACCDVDRVLGRRRGRGAVSPRQLADRLGHALEHGLAVGESSGGTKDEHGRGARLGRRWIVGRHADDTPFEGARILAIGDDAAELEHWTACKLGRERQARLALDEGQRFPGAAAARARRSRARHRKSQALQL